METKTCFLLTHSWRDLKNKVEVTLFAQTAAGDPVQITITNFRPLFFVPRSTPMAACQFAAERAPRDLRSVLHEPVDCLYFNTVAQSRDAATRLRSQGIRVFESDIHPVERYLMERLVKGCFSAEGDFVEGDKITRCTNPRIRGIQSDAPNLKVMSIDIETNAATNEIYSIACSGISDTVFVVGWSRSTEWMQCLIDEHTLLQRFLAHIALEDPDIIIGWSIEDFDLRVLQERCTAQRIPFVIGRNAIGQVLPPRTQGNSWRARIPGRVVLDVPTMLRANFQIFSEWSLGFVAHAMLGKGKLIEETGAEKIAEINRLFKEDKPSLAKYNLEDALLTKEIFEKASILPNAVQRARLSGQLLDRPGGSVAAFDFLYLPLLHRHGHVALDVIDAPPPNSALPGGYVMEPTAGLYENVLVFDFRSLYPSIIMTFKIDPLGLLSHSEQRIVGPTGTSFASDETILPDIIAHLMNARSEAKKQNNQPLSQAIKILMNSFYGVLGAQGCRFFSARLAEAITQTGQYILKSTAAYIQETYHFPILYGDTDSLFVLLGPHTDSSAPETGKTVTSGVNDWLTNKIRTEFGADSALELEFETHYRHFLLPTVRGGGQGSKKHYCGAFEYEGSLRLSFTGMESVRTDWTEMAKDFQHELVMKLFTHEPVEDFIRQKVVDVRLGKLDSKLVYKKRLRKDLSEYAGSAPPHVQAARLLDKPGSSIRYVITVAGPQPLTKQSALLDYDHYIEAQLQPIAETILEVLGKSFTQVISGQQDLFG